MRQFKDHFSGHAGNYAAHRPVYPDALFSYLASLCERKEHAWDCATGNGQAAASLNQYFRHVIATDASAEQIASATPVDGIEFRVAPAEASGIRNNSVDLVTVAQALHWFDIVEFFSEATRVLRNGGLLAYWCYEHCRVEPQCDRVIWKIFETVEPYWPPEREYVENRYSDIVPPLPEVPAEKFAMDVHWTADQILSYMHTWSAAQRYLRETGADPVRQFAEELHAVWGAEARKVSWPLTIRLCRKC